MKTFSALLAICAVYLRVPVNSPHKGQWRGALMFSLICVWINGWVNNREAGDLRRYRAYYDVIVKILKYIDTGWHNQQSCFTTWSSDIRCIRKQGISIITLRYTNAEKWEFVQCIFGYNPNWHKILFWSNRNYVNRVIRPRVRLNINKSSYQYRDFYVKIRRSQGRLISLTWESPYPGKTAFILRRGPSGDKQHNTPPQRYAINHRSQPCRQPGRQYGRQSHNKCPRRNYVHRSARQDACPALGAQCCQCGKTGHFDTSPWCKGSVMKSSNRKLSRSGR